MKNPRTHNCVPGRSCCLARTASGKPQTTRDELFGKARVGEAIAEMANLTAAQIEAGIYQRLQEYCNHRSHDDDITYVVIKILGSAQE